MMPKCLFSRNKKLSLVAFYSTLRTDIFWVNDELHQQHVISLVQTLTYCSETKLVYDASNVFNCHLVCANI